MNNNAKKGLLFALFAATISGLAIFYNKLNLTTGIDPQIFNIIKNGGVAILLTLFFLSPKKIREVRKISPSNLKRLVTVSIIGGSIPFILYFDGLKSVSAINANLIHKSMFIFVALLAIPFLKERLNSWQIIGYFLAAASNLFIGGFTGFSLNYGELMILGATLFWSLENILVKITVKDLDSTLAAWTRMTLGTFIILGYVIATGKIYLFSSLTTSQILPLGGSILLLTGYVIFWYKALQYAPATAVTSVLILATPITNILSAVFITHVFPIPQTLNLVGSLLGIILITLLTQKAAKTAPETS